MKLPRLASAIAAVSLLAVGTAAQAGNVYWSIGISVPPIGTVVSNAPAVSPYYYEPPAMYAQPVIYAPPVAYAPPVVYAPPRVVYRPVPVAVWPAPRFHHDGLPVRHGAPVPIAYPGGPMDGWEPRKWHHDHENRGERRDEYDRREHRDEYGRRFD
jgi:hypothetical protein